MYICMYVCTYVFNMTIPIVGDVLLASGVIAYLGSFTPEFRSKEISKWLIECRAKNVPCSQDFSLATVSPQVLPSDSVQAGFNTP